MQPIKMPVVFGKNRTRGNSVGATIDDMYGEHTELRNLLAKEARGQGVDPSADWLTNAVAGLLRLYEQSHDAWVSSKGETIGHVYEAELPSGAKLLMGSRQILSQIDEVRIDEGADAAKSMVAGLHTFLGISDEKRIGEAVALAEEAFWLQIAESFPEMTSGDLAPEAAIKLTAAMTAGVTTWLESNRAPHKTPIQEALELLDEFVGHTGHYGAMPVAHSDAYRDSANAAAVLKKARHDLATDSAGASVPPAEVLDALQKLLPHVQHYATLPHVHPDANKHAASASAVISNAQSNARVEALPRLQQQAGAAYTLYQIASKALHQTAGDPMHVDWGQVHQDVFVKAVGQDKQPVDTVLEAIKRHSPGAITPEQIAVVEAMGELKKQGLPLPISHQIKVRLENDDGTEDVVFTAADVLAHNGETRSWQEISDDPHHQHAQMSLAEDYALFHFKRRHGDEGDYRVDVLEGLTDKTSEQIAAVDAKGRAEPELVQVLDIALAHVKACASYDRSAVHRLNSEGMHGSAHEAEKQLATREAAISLIENAIAKAVDQDKQRAASDNAAPSGP